MVEALLDQLLQPELVTAILTNLRARRDDRQASADRRLVDLARQVTNAEERLSRLYASIEAGTIDGTDPTLEERVAALKTTRDRALEALDYAKNSSAVPIEIDLVAIDRFTRLICEQFVSEDVIARKAYLSAIVPSSTATAPSASSAQMTISGPRSARTANREPRFVNLLICSGMVSHSE
ncbi:hypothetical protein QWJ07_27110 [Frankia sp. RB7]|nr:hypothetical protein [Frankia sp. RB7]